MINPHDPIAYPFEHIAHAACAFLDADTDDTNIALDAALINTARIAPDTAIVEIDTNHAARTIWVLLDTGQELLIHADTGHINHC